MANGRLISRDFFTSGDLEDLPAAARLVFAGMIVYADDAGVIRDQPVLFARLFCYGIDVRPCRIRAWLDALACRGCIESVFCEGVKCWKIRNFSKFQRLKRREGKRREDEEKGIATGVNSPQPEGPLLDSEEDPRAEAFAFFERELGAKPKHDAWGAICKLGTTPQDIEAWRKAVVWAKEHSKLDDPIGFVLSKALSFKNPKAAGLTLEPRRGSTDSAHRSSLNEPGKFDHA